MKYAGHGMWEFETPDRTPETPLERRIHGLVKRWWIKHRGDQGFQKAWNRGEAQDAWETWGQVAADIAEARASLRVHLAHDEHAAYHFWGPQKNKAGHVKKSVGFDEVYKAWVNTKDQHGLRFPAWYKGGQPGCELPRMKGRTKRSLKHMCAALRPISL